MYSLTGILRDPATFVLSETTYYMKSIGLFCVAVVSGLAKDMGSLQSEPVMKTILGGKN